MRAFVRMGIYVHPRVRDARQMRKKGPSGTDLPEQPCFMRRGLSEGH